MKKWLYGLLLLLTLVPAASADWKGDLQKGGITSNGKDVKINSGYLQSRVAVINYATTTSARTITQAECHNTVFCMTEVTNGTFGNDPVTFNLPAITAANIGMVVTFIDLNATSGANIVINPDDSDSIAGGTAGVSYNSGGTTLGECITLVAVDASNWYPISKIGTWAAGS